MWKGDTYNLGPVWGKEKGKGEKENRNRGICRIRKKKKKGRRTICIQNADFCS